LAQQNTRESAVTAVARSTIGAPQWAQPRPTSPDPSPAARAQLAQQVELAVLADDAGRRDERRRAAGAGFVDRELVTNVQALHARLGSRARAGAA